MSKLGLKTLVVAFLFWYGLGYFNMATANIGDIREVNILIVFFLGVLLVGYRVGYASVPKRQLQPTRIQDYSFGSRTLVILVVVFSVGIALVPFSRVVGGMLNYHLIRVIVALGILAYVYGLLFGGWKRALLLLFFVFVVIFSLSVYSRRPFLTLLAPIILVPLIRNRYHISLVLPIGSMAGALGLISLLYVTGLRYLGSSASLLDIVSLVRQGLGAILLGKGFDTIVLTKYVMETYDSSTFLYGQTFFAGFINFIPRSIWAGKPVAFGMILSAQYFNIQLNDIFTNFGPGIIAEAYANGGYLATLIVAALLGFIVGLADRFIENNRYDWNHVLLGVVFYPALFFLIRGDFVNSFYEFYSKAVVIYLVTAGFGLRRRLRASQYGKSDRLR